VTPKETCAETGIANDEAKILPSSHFVVIFVLRLVTTCFATMRRKSIRLPYLTVRNANLLA